MNELETQLLRAECGGAEPAFCLRTHTTIDAGRWWRPTPVWLCIVGDELMLLAVARRRFVERVKLAECHASYYHHATGQLVIEPTEQLRIKHLSLTPREALDVLNHLRAS
jgi:hypothetical protein